jgi:tubulin-folding cofactor B
MGRFGTTSTQISEGLASTQVLPTSIQVGSRCEVEGGRRGVIRYTGETEFAKGYWVGVEYDEPVGKNDGSVAGKRYFTCRAKYGGFVKSEKVDVGDYPEKDLMEEEDEEI